MNQTPRSCLQYSDALAVGRAWLAAGGRPEVEIGALEPLLWRDGQKRISDLVAGLTDLGLTVSITTNASMLASCAWSLRAAGLSLLRISWHTTDPDSYKHISGHGEYENFRAGI